MTKDVVQNGKHTKAVLQDAVRDLLPLEIVDRPKVAFQDGAGLKVACAEAVANPKRFYTAVHAANMRGGWQ